MNFTYIYIFSFSINLCKRSKYRCVELFSYVIPSTLKIFKFRRPSKNYGEINFADIRGKDNAVKI